MRKAIITLIVIALLVGGYYWVSQTQVRFSALEGIIVQAKRGDLVIPITASGKIEPASVTEIKSKASGEAIEIPFDLGAMVKKGNLVVRLLDVDEQNSVDRAKSDYERAQIALENAKIALEEKKTVTKPLAEAKLEQAEAQLARAQVAFDFQENLKQKSPEDVTPSTYTEVMSMLREAKAAVAGARAEVVRADIAGRMAEQDIKTAQETVNTSKKTLDDAEQRLLETKVYSPIDGMVLERKVQKGEVIQGGKTMFTGGTVLMKIADVSQIYAVVNVDEADIGQVRDLAPASARPGPQSTQPATMSAEILGSEPVEITVESFKDEKFQGIIERISPQSEINQAIATFKVWIRINSDNREKLVGLLNTQAEAHFTARAVKDAVLVDYDAFQKDPDSDAYGVYVPHIPPGKNVPEPKFKPCKFGGDNGIEVEVREGLEPGDRVYAKLPMKTKREKEAEEEEEENE